MEVKKMSLVDRFDGEMGDLVLFMDNRPTQPNIIGYIMGFSGGYPPKKVKLSNKSVHVAKGLSDNTSVWRVKFFEKYLPQERRYTIDLRDWNGYKIFTPEEVGSRIFL